MSKLDTEHVIKLPQEYHEECGKLYDQWLEIDEDISIDEYYLTNGSERFAKAWKEYIDALDAQRARGVSFD